MKSILLIVVVYVSISNARLSPRQSRLTKFTTDELDMGTICANAVKEQIQDEISASMMYLSMGAHFSQDDIDRPGFAEFFFQSAGGKREQAIKLIDYLLMRLTRIPLNHVANLIKVDADSVKHWNSGVDALGEALVAEAKITENIKLLIQKCQTGNRRNDYHVVDFLTTELLDKQYHDQRTLAEKIASLEKLLKSELNGEIGEFLFDKQFLN